MELTVDILIEKYGKDDALFIKEELERMIQSIEETGEECVFNCRVALKDDPIDEEEYEELLAEGGCSKFYDDEIESISGNVYKIGFNYEV